MMQYGLDLAAEVWVYLRPILLGLIVAGCLKVAHLLMTQEDTPEKPLDKSDQDGKIASDASQEVSQQQGAVYFSPGKTGANPWVIRANGRFAGETPGVFVYDIEHAKTFEFYLTANQYATHILGLDNYDIERAPNTWDDLR